MCGFVHDHFVLFQLVELEQDKSAHTEQSNKRFFELKEQLGSLECENERLRKEIEAAVSSKDELFTQLTQRKHDSEAEINEYKTRVVSQSEELAEARTLVETLKNDVETFEVSIKEKDEHVSQVERERAELREKMDAWRDSLEGREKKLADDVNKLETTVAELNDALKQVCLFSKCFLFSYNRFEM